MISSDLLPAPPPPPPKVKKEQYSPEAWEAAACALEALSTLPISDLDYDSVPTPPASDHPSEHMALDDEPGYVPYPTDAIKPLSMPPFISEPLPLIHSGPYPSPEPLMFKEEGAPKIPVIKLMQSSVSGRVTRLSASPVVPVPMIDPKSGGLKYFKCPAPNCSKVCFFVAQSSGL